MAADARGRHPEEGADLGRVEAADVAQGEQAAVLRLQVAVRGEEVEALGDGRGDRPRDRRGVGRGSRRPAGGAGCGPAGGPRWRPPRRARDGGAPGSGGCPACARRSTRPPARRPRRAGRHRRRHTPPARGRRGRRRRAGRRRPRRPRPPARPRRPPRGPRSARWPERRCRSCHRDAAGAAGDSPRGSVSPVARRGPGDRRCGPRVRASRNGRRMGRSSVVAKRRTARLSQARPIVAAMPTDLEDAWSDLHDATPAGWFVGRPSYDEGRRVWEQYAFDPSERARAGVRSREWTAVAPTELGGRPRAGPLPAADPRGAGAGVAARTRTLGARPVLRGGRSARSDKTADPRLPTRDRRPETADPQSTPMCHKIWQTHMAPGRSAHPLPANGAGRASRCRGPWWSLGGGRVLGLGRVGGRRPGHFEPTVPARLTVIRQRGLSSNFQTTEARSPVT